jgi:ribosome-associated heat shock protein Hsp15
MARQQHNPSTPTNAVRIDKWLWAARFYKTRSLASEAIKGGKIHCGGTRVKPSKEVHLGDEITIRQAYWHKTVVVKALSDKRGPASQAALLYEETPASIAERERLTVTKQAQPAFRDRGAGRPTKRERRRIIAFTEKNN